MSRTSGERKGRPFNQGENIQSQVQVSEGGMTRGAGLAVVDERFARDERGEMRDYRENFRRLGPSDSSIVSQKLQDE
jgi:hypothetical protein